MASAIDPTKPLNGVPASKAELRANLLAAKTEIEALQSDTASHTTSISTINSDILNLRALQFNVMDFAPPGTDKSAVLNGAADCFPTFAAAGVYLRTLDPKRLYELVFPPGYYVPSDGWTFTSIPRIRFKGYGAKIRSAGSVGGNSTRIFNTRDPFRITADLENNLKNSEQTLHLGYLVSTADAASNTITLVTSGDSANFTVGSYALIHGFDTRRAASTPPSLAFFEFVRIEAIDGDEITIQDHLRYTYSPTWVDLGLSIGEGPAYLTPWEDRLGCVFYGFEGFAVEPKDLLTQTNRGNLTPYSIFADIRNVDAPDSSLNAQMGEHMTVEGVNVWRMEQDKLLSSLVVRNSRFAQVEGGSNLTKATWIDTNITDRLSCECKSMKFERCSIPPESEVFCYEAGNISFTENIYSGPPFRLYSTLGSATGAFAYTSTNSGGRTTALNFAIASANIKRRLEIGDLIIMAPATGSGPIFAVVTGFQQNTSSTDVVLVQSSGEIVDNGRIHFAQEREGYIWRDNQPDLNANNVGLCQPLIVPRRSGTGVFSGKNTLFSTGQMWSFYRRAIRPLRYVVNVRKAYSGSDASCLLRFTIGRIDSTWTGASATSVNIDVDLKTAGYREITPLGSTTPLGADANFSNLTAFFTNPDYIMVNHELLLQSSIGSRAMTGDSDNTPNPAAMPVVEAKFEYEVLSALMFTGLTS